MKITIQKQIGKANLTFILEEDKAQDALVAATAFTTMPDKCGKCGGEDVVLDSNKADAYTFVKVKCQNSKCRATSTMGSYKDGSGHFWKAFEIYNSNEQAAPAPTAPVKEKSQEKSDEDLPF